MGGGYAVDDVPPGGGGLARPPHDAPTRLVELERVIQEVRHGGGDELPVEVDDQRGIGGLDFQPDAAIFRVQAACGRELTEESGD